jgi:Dynamin family
VTTAARTGKAVAIAQAKALGRKAVGLLDAGLPAGAAEVERVLGQRPPRPTVVVVGETKRGKSSLVNALLNMPGLSPVDSQIATSTYLVFQHAAAAAARAVVPGVPAPVPVPVGELADWATAAGERPDGTPPPRLIEVDCTSPLLTNLTIVDTPGVGGLDAAHGEIALTAARQATALLFVLDAGAPLTRPELDFLVIASESVDLVLFAVTKTDAHRGWREIVEDDRALLREHAPRFADAPVLPVSSRLFEAAGKIAAGETAAKLRTDSGIIDVQLALQTRVAAKAAALHEANALRAARTQLLALSAGLTSEQHSVDPAPGRAQALRADRDRLAQSRRQDGRAWQLRLRAEMSRARIGSMHDVQREAREQVQQWRAWIDRADSAGLTRLPGELDAVVQALTLRAGERLVERLRRVADTVLRDMFAPDELDEVYAGLVRTHTGPAYGAVSGPDSRSGTAEDRLMLVTGATAGFAAGRIVAFIPAMFGMAAIPGIGWVLAPVSLGLGLAVSGWMVRSRRLMADRQHHKLWVAETLTEARAALETDLAARFVDAEQALTLALDAAIARRVETLDREIKQLDEALRMDAGERDKRRAALREATAEVRQLLVDIDALLPVLRTGGAR